MKMFVSRKHLPLIQFVSREMPPGVHALQALHQVIEGFNVAVTGCKLPEPLAKCLVERGMALASHETGAVNEFVFGAEGNVAHTEVVYTKIVLPGITSTKAFRGAEPAALRGFPVFTEFRRREQRPSGP